MIEVNHLSKHFGSVQALQDITFTAEKGKILGFLGPNGAGKSTTMNIITGYLSPSSGSVRVGGYHMLEQPRQAKRLIGYLPEVPPLYKDMTVREYLEFAYELKGAQEPRQKHLEDICQRVKLQKVWGRLIRNLSKGYQQRVGLAQALIGDPPVLILDEPTIGLDPQQITEIRSLIRNLGERHTVVFSSHILPEVQSVCDRILIINQGRIVADGTTESLSRGLSGGGKLAAEIKGDPQKVAALLSAIPGIRQVQRGVQSEKGVFEFSLSLDPDTDPRQAVFEQLVQASYPLLGLRKEGMTLEEIFLKLTSSPPQESGDPLLDISHSPDHTAKEGEK